MQPARASTGFASTGSVMKMSSEVPRSLLDEWARACERVAAAQADPG